MGGKEFECVSYALYSFGHWIGTVGVMQEGGEGVKKGWLALLAGAGAERV